MRFLGARVGATAEFQNHYFTWRKDAVDREPGLYFCKLCRHETKGYCVNALPTPLHNIVFGLKCDHVVHKKVLIGDMWENNRVPVTLNYPGGTIWNFEGRYVDKEPTYINCRCQARMERVRNLNGHGWYRCEDCNAERVIIVQTLPLV